MFENLDDFISHDALMQLDKTGKPTTFELQIATIALLLEMAASDGLISSQETDSILNAAWRALGVEGEDAGELMEVAMILRAEKDRTERFVASINENFSADQKEHLLTLIWKVLLIDGKVEKSETAFATALRKHLGLSLEQAVRARKLAEMEKGKCSPPSHTAESEEEEDDEG